MIKKIGGIGNVLLIIIFITVYSYAFLHKSARVNNAMYVKGVITKIDQGVRGNVHLNYSFIIADKVFNGFVSMDFCKECNYSCCHPGDSVIVRYKKNNPDNNDLVHNMPNK